MLYLIGTGLEPEDMSLKGIRIAKTCDEIYAEKYTNIYDFSKIENMLKRKIIVLSREKVESDFLIKKAEEKNISLLIPGDPLFATTHIQLLISAKEMHVPIKIIHAPSIFNAVARTGLSMYKFGRITSLVKQKALSTLDIIRKNLSYGLHTLILLDLDLSLKEALKQIETLRLKKRIFICSCLGTQNEIVLYDFIHSFNKYLKKPLCIVIPGNIDHNEKEIIEKLF